MIGISGNILNPDEAGRVAVLMGGCSSERDISLKSGRAVEEALKKCGVDVVCLDLETTDPQQIKELLLAQCVDVAFLALHGGFGEDGQIQKILDQAGIAYTGCGPLASRLAMNKAETQRILSQAGVLVPRYEVVRREDRDLPTRVGRLGGFPVVVKPAAGGSSIGVAVVREISQLALALDQAVCHGSEVLLEQYISGRELTVGILDADALPVVEIKPQAGFFDFKSKYEKGQSEYLVPAPLDQGLAQKVQDISLKVFQTLGCRDLARVDIMLSKENKLYVLEVNTIPGFTSTSLLPMAANCQGIVFAELCWRLVVMAAGRG